MNNDYSNERFMLYLFSKSNVTNNSLIDIDLAKK